MKNLENEENIDVENAKIEEILDKPITKYTQKNKTLKSLSSSTEKRSTSKITSKTVKTPEEALKEFISDVPKILKDHDNALIKIMEELENMKKVISTVASTNRPYLVGSGGSDGPIYGVKREIDKIAPTQSRGSGLIDMIGKFVEALPQILKSDGGGVEAQILKENANLLKEVQQTSLRNMMTLSNQQVELGKLGLQKMQKELTKDEEW